MYKTVDRLEPVIDSALPNKEYFYLCVYAFAIIAAEVVTAFYNSFYGISCHVLLLLALLTQASLSHRDGIRQVYAALSIAPLIRILSLCMPLPGIQPIYWYLVISLPLFASAAAVIRLADYRSRDMGLIVGNLPLQLAVAILGLPFGLVEYLILKPVPLTPLTFSDAFLPALILVVSTGFLEEFIFRGIMYRACVGILGRWHSIFYISFIFSILHISYRSVSDLIFVFTISLLFSVIAAFSRSILGISLAHGIINVSLYILWPQLLK
jgi:membrane protease YdiL (CAAX protease family)